MEYDATIRIKADLDKIDNYKIDTEGIKRFRETVAKMEKVIADSFNIQATKQSFEMLNKVVKDSYTSIFEQYDFENMLKDFRLVIDEMADVMDFAQLEILKNIDFSKICRDSFYRERYDEASKMAFDYAEEEIKGEENITQEELLELFNEQIEDKDGWQEKLQSKSKEFKEKYTAFCKFFTWFFDVLITAIVTYFLNLGIAYIHGKIVSEPKEDAPAIYYFDQRTEVNIINETDNYYFITYIDDDGNEVMGYSLKENIEFVPEESEKAEVSIEDSTER